MIAHIKEFFDRPKFKYDIMIQCISCKYTHIYTSVNDTPRYCTKCGVASFPSAYLLTQQSRLVATTWISRGIK